MIVHELGHMLGSWLCGIPAISFFFASFAFSDRPALGLVAFLWVCELIGLYWAHTHNRKVLVVLCLFLAFCHLFFLMQPAMGVEFLTWNGVGGEFLLPLIFTAVLLEMPTAAHLKLLFIHGLCSLVFWRSTFKWVAALLDLAPIPYPRDGTGGFVLFQDPFSVGSGAPVGDIDKLVKLYAWSEIEVVRFYVATAAVCLLAYSALWFYFINKQQLFLSDSNY